MPGKLPQISPLKLRKQMLIAESELNRSQLIEEWESATEWHRALSAGARTVGSAASAAALLVSAVRAFRRNRGPKDSAESSWLQPIVKGASAISSLWAVF